jgi:hypothetical protein
LETWEFRGYTSTEELYSTHMTCNKGSRVGPPKIMEFLWSPIDRVEASRPLRYWLTSLFVSWNWILIVTGYRFGIRGPSLLSSTYLGLWSLVGVLGVEKGGTREKLAEKAGQSSASSESFQIKNWSAYGDGDHTPRTLPSILAFI